jgi:hypothetical protein
LEQQEFNPGKKKKIFLLWEKFFRSVNVKKITLNNRLLIFSFFLLLSILFWFLTVMNKEYETVLSYPVKYIRFPKGKVLVNDVPERLDLSVQSRGFTLLRFKLKSRLVPIIFDVNSFSLNTIAGKKPLTMYILTDYAIEKIQQQLSSEIRVVSISPDSLYFQFADMHSKKIKVTVNLDMEFEKQYMQVADMIIKPDSVMISGPGTMIDTIEYAGTIPKKMTGINENVELDMKLQPIENVEYSVDEVSITIPVEKFTEVAIKIPIEVLNVPDTLFLRMFPNEVEIVYRVGLSDFGKVNEHMFQAVVDYADKENNIGNKLKVDLRKAPEYVMITDYHPKNIEYIIEK